MAGNGLLLNRWNSLMNRKHRLSNQQRIGSHSGQMQHWQSRRTTQATPSRLENPAKPRSTGLKTQMCRRTTQRTCNSMAHFPAIWISWASMGHLSLNPRQIWEVRLKKKKPHIMIPGLISLFKAVANRASLKCSYLMVKNSIWVILSVNLIIHNLKTVLDLLLKCKMNMVEVGANRLSTQWAKLKKHQHSNFKI